MLKYDKCLRETELYLEKNVNNSNNAEGKIATKTNVESDALTADHRYSAIGRHLRDAHGNVDLLNESQFRMLKKCGTKWDCLVYEMLYIRTIRPNLDTQSDSIRAKLFV